MNEWEHFKLEYDPNSTTQYPDGYWAASTGDYDATGNTPLNALAKLVIELNKIVVMESLHTCPLCSATEPHSGDFRESICSHGFHGPRL